MKRIAIFGATGLAGGGVLRACLAAPEVARVVAVTRRPLGFENQKLSEVRCEDFSHLGSITAAVGDIDACFYCLGVSASRVGEAEYRVITKDYALEAARTLKAASPSHTFHFLTGVGTNIDSRMMWSCVKAETEEALKGLGLAGVICWRPAMILPEHLPAGVTPWGGRALYPLLRLLRFIPSLSVGAEALGLAMLEATLEGLKEGTFENLAIRAIAERYYARTCH